MKELLVLNNKKKKPTSTSTMIIPNKTHAVSGNCKKISQANPSIIGGSLSLDACLKITNLPIPVLPNISPVQKDDMAKRKNDETTLIVGTYH
jgi:hypothetical protein